MADKNYTLNFDPIHKALERLICEPRGLEFSAAETAEILAVYRVLMEVVQIDPREPVEFYNQVGVAATIYLGRRVLSQKIAANLFERLQPPQT